MKELVINLIATTVLMGPIASAAQEWQQGGKEENWPDPNFVPCEGMGATASGNIEVKIGYAVKSGVVRVSDWQLRTRYFHDHSSSASLTYERPSGGRGSIRLERPWFPTIGPNDGSHYLVLARNGSQTGPHAQTPFEMKAGSEISISLTTVFPQYGGTCVSSFSEDLTLP